MRQRIVRAGDGGRVIQDILSHVYNAAEWLVGPMDRLQADAARLRVAGVEVEDTVNVLARHEGVLAAYTVNQHQSMAEFTLDVHGENGSLRADFGRNFWALAQTPDGEWETHRLSVWTKEAWFERQAVTFLKMVEWQTPPPCSLKEAVTTMHAIRATLRAVDATTNWTPVIPSPGVRRCLIWQGRPPS
ncbi:MAG: hypothetical protein H7A44_13105 [Opitutaceae bacterium]|nr:hypothetical protein [Opitutaceae bacterium]